LKKQAVVLFAHGSRDPGWARPFEQLASTLRELVDGPVVLAYLELMKPSLAEAIDGLAGQVTSIRIVPVFLGAGGHVKEDLPRLANVAAAKHPSMQISVEPPIGEQSAIIQALANAIALGR
jgi:sirohydrochlorin cobaltochelatase